MKYSKFLIFFVAALADLISGFVKRRSWAIAPKQPYMAALRALCIRNTISTSEYAIIQTFEGTKYFGPKNPSEYMCGRFSMWRLQRFINEYSRRENGAIHMSKAELALVHNLVMRKQLEFTSYPYLFKRTENLRAGDIFVDVGAFRGYVALKASMLVGQNGHVIAVEPITENSEIIKRQIEENQIENITVLPAALTLEECAEVSFYRDGNQRNSYSAAYLSKSTKTLPVKNIAAIDLVAMIKEAKIKRAIISITTNGTEDDLGSYLFDSLSRELDYLEIIVPEIFIRAENLERCAIVSGATILHEYPWMRMIYVRD